MSLVLSDGLSVKERELLSEICDKLCSYDKDFLLYLSDFVASLCNVDKSLMLSKTNQLDVAQARWLFWYSYRYATHETYEKIGVLSGGVYSCKFTKVGVASGVNKMSCLISKEAIWRKRWLIIKEMLCKRNDSLFSDEKGRIIKITVPKDIEIEIKRI